MSGARLSVWGRREFVGAEGEMCCVRVFLKRLSSHLLSYCNKVGAETGRSGALVMAGYLKLMKKHPGYFFSDPWSVKPVQKWGLWLQDDKDDFLSQHRGYRDEVERFTVIMLKRNVCLEGFNAEGFASDFSYYGKLLCLGCGVPEAMYLRKYLWELEKSNIKVAEDYKANPGDRFYSSIYEDRFSTQAIRDAKMKRVELEFLELYGGTEGKDCEARNKCLCPYGAKSSELIKLGHQVKMLWKIVEYYHSHWHSSKFCGPSKSDYQWYHLDEEDFLDVTSLEDILKAVEDGRIERIAEERQKTRGSHSSNLDLRE
jgi:hypothetical protein